MLAVLQTASNVRFFVLILVFFSIDWVEAQVKFNVNVSDKHLKKVEKAGGARERIKTYKKFYSKDSLRAAKKAWKKYKIANKDSLKTEGIWREAKQNQKAILEGRWNQYKRKVPEFKVDSLNWPEPKDSLDWALRELAIQGEWERLQGIYREHAHYDSAFLEHYQLDSIQLDTTALLQQFQVKERIASYMPEGLAQETDYSLAEQLSGGYGEIDGLGQFQKVDKSGVKDFFKNVSPEQFSKSQLSMQAAKTKFSKLPNLEKEEEGIKRESLEGTPWKNRIFLGGHFTVQSTDPIVVDTDVRIGYKWNKKWSSGMGLILREQFTNRATSITGDAHGLAFFSSYDWVSSLFLYGEYQQVQNRSLFSESGQPVQWQQAYLLGIGRAFQFSKKFRTSVTLLYDFNFKNNDLNVRPLQVRVGYRVEL